MLDHKASYENSFCFFLLKTIYMYWEVIGFNQDIIDITNLLIKKFDDLGHLNTQTTRAMLTRNFLFENTAFAL